MESCRGSRDSPSLRAKIHWKRSMSSGSAGRFTICLGSGASPSAYRAALNSSCGPSYKKRSVRPRDVVLSMTSAPWNHLHRIQLVTYTDLTGRVDQHIPQAQVLIQLPQQEHFDTCTRLFLVAIKAGWEHLGIIEDKHILVVEIVKDVFKVLAMLDIPALLAATPSNGIRHDGAQDIGQSVLQAI